MLPVRCSLGCCSWARPLAEQCIRLAAVEQEGKQHGRCKSWACAIYTVKNALRPYTLPQPAAAPPRISRCLGCRLPASLGGRGWEASGVAGLPHTLFLNHAMPAAAHQCRCGKVSVVVQAGQHLRKGEEEGALCRMAAGGGGGSRATNELLHHNGLQRSLVRTFCDR